MRHAIGLIAAVALGVLPRALPATAPQGNAAGEYSKHFSALSQLSIAVADTMPAEKYGFRPHPESMSFGELMSHVASTNYQFCAGLKDTNTPALPSPSDKEAIVRFLSDSFQYCSTVINSLTEEQLNAVHNSPDGRLPGREVLLAMYIHVAHHRGQAEIYLRDNGIKPPAYRI
ncbi:MAG: DinB family protein [Silvibacterium sp.]|nr:DinB family protein [Silvibacterium sp.]MBV8438835.1 DinB family protein [Silvibacterium sp.]